MSSSSSSEGDSKNSSSDDENIMSSVKFFSQSERTNRRKKKKRESDAASSPKFRKTNTNSRLNSNYSYPTNNTTITQQNALVTTSNNSNLENSSEDEALNYGADSECESLSSESSEDENTFENYERLMQIEIENTNFDVITQSSAQSPSSPVNQQDSTQNSQNFSGNVSNLTDSPQNSIPSGLAQTNLQEKLSKYFEDVQNEEISIPQQFFYKIDEKINIRIIDIYLFFLQILVHHRTSYALLDSFLFLINKILPKSKIPKQFKTIKSHLDTMGLRIDSLYVDDDGIVWTNKPTNKPSKEICYFPIIRAFKIIEKYGNLSSKIFMNFEELSKIAPLGDWFKTNFEGNYPLAAIRGGTDGLSVFSSIFSEVYPFMGSFLDNDSKHEKTIRDFFTIAITSFTDKPDDIDCLLIPVIQELIYLWNIGYKTQDLTTIKIVVLPISADLEAKVKILHYSQWNAKFGCIYCKKVNEYDSNTVCWFGPCGALRNHKPTAADIGKFGVKKLSPFLQIPYVSLLFHFPPELMHHWFVKGVAENVIKNEIKKICGNSKKNKDDFFSLISTKLKSIQIHSDFGRNLRLNEKCLKNLKAEEIKKLFLKVLFVVMEEFMDDDSVDVWNSLRLIMLKSVNPSPSEIDTALVKRKASSIVDSIANCYGKNTISMKTHHLKHFPMFLKEFNSLSPFTAFDFENYLSYLKDMVHSKMGLDEPFSFASNVNFFLNEITNTINDYSLEKKQKHQEKIHYGKVFESTPEQISLIKKQIFKCLHPNANNGNLSADWGPIQTCNWVSIEGIAFDTISLNFSSKRAFRKNCYVFQRHQNVNYDFFQIETILKVSHQNQDEVWFQMRNFKMIGTVRNNNIDPILKITKKVTCEKYDKEKFQKMCMYKENDHFFPILV